MDGEVADGGVDAPVDAPVADVPGVDVPGVDAPPPDVPGVDAPPPDVPGVDAGPMGGYLDRCSVPADCMSSLCVSDTDSTRFCSRTCTGHPECADEHICVEGTCEPDDTGDPCSTASPASCNLGLCIGTVGGPAHCTRQCSNAGECPSGFACTRAGGSAFKICVEVEKPCTAGGNECGTGLCIPAQGCTSTCDSATDCPIRGTAFGVTPYTCEFDSGVGSNVCIPPIDIMGSDRIGALCSAPLNACRSGLCADLNDGDAIPEQCVQVCGPEGGCPSGMACQPQVLDDLSIHAFCVTAGTASIGAACATGAACASALCDDPGGYCTRLCADGICPTGWTCTPVPGSSLAICRR